MVSQWYDPEGGSAVVPGFVARSLLRLGLQVDVITGFPNYPEGRIQTGYRGKLLMREMREGVSLQRVPLYPNHGSGMVGRVVSYLSFAFSSLLGVNQLRNCDVVLIYSTPVTAGLGPTLTKWLHRKPIVTLIQDLWPDTLIYSGLLSRSSATRPLVGIVSRLSTWIYKQSDHVVVISPGMRNKLLERGFSPDRVTLVPNWIPDDSNEARMTVPQSSDGSLPRKRKGLFRVAYAGNLGHAQDASIIVNAAKLLKDRRDIEFVIAGSGTLEQALRSRVEQESLKNVQFLGQVHPDDVPHIIHAADVQLITLSADPLFAVTTPSKVQFSLNFGRPIVASVGGDAAQILGETPGATVVRPGDARAMAQAIAQIAELSETQQRTMGRENREFFERRFAEDVGAPALAKILQHEVDRRRSIG